MNWKVSVELIGLEPEEAGLMATLSQAYLEWEQRTEERGIEQGIEQGAKREARSLVLRLLTRRVGDIPEALGSPLNNLSLEQLESLGEALLDFSTIADLETWLRDHQ